MGAESSDLHDCQQGQHLSKRGVDHDEDVDELLALAARACECARFDTERDQQDGDDLCGNPEEREITHGASVAARPVPPCLDELPSPEKLPIMLPTPASVASLDDESPA